MQTKSFAIGMTGIKMKKYINYEITETVQTFYSKVYSAYKKNAMLINGISFNHKFFFQKTNFANANCIVNGIPSKEFEPDFDNNFYYAFVEGGIIYSIDMDTFFFEKKGFGYFNREEISYSDLLLKKQKNIDIE